ncbi:MAG: CHAD domain-containing protein [Candidatus Dormibacteria bacterium]
MAAADVASCCGVAQHSFASRADDLRWAAARLPMAGDSQAVHDVRVALRRLRETAHAFAGCLDSRPDLAAQLRRQERRLGPLRDAEVRLELLDRVLGPVAVWRDRSDDPGLLAGPDSAVVPGSAERPRPGLRGLETEARRVLADRTAREIERRRQARLTPSALARLQELAVPISPAAGHPGRLSARELAREQLPQRFRRAARPGSTAADLHRRRIRLRRLRFRLELFAPLISPGAEPVLAELRRLQQLLGRFHDLAVLAAWIDRCARRERPELRPALRRLAVRAALEQQAAAEVARIELAHLDQAGWWATAEAACLA